MRNVLSLLKWPNFESPRAVRSRRRKLAARRLVFERCEPRTLLAADIAITGFDSDGVNLLVHYDISGENASEFMIAVYASSDGANRESVLATRTVSDSADLAVGTGHVISLDVSNGGLEVDKFMLALVDAWEEVSETNEGNNQLLFEGGVFRAGDELHIYGTNAADSVNVSGGTSASVTLNSTVYSFTESEITRIRVFGYGGDDGIVFDSAFDIPVTALGGAGNDGITGGAGDDTLYGGDGNDEIDGGAGVDHVYGEAGNDTLSTGLGGTGGSGSGEWYGYASDDFLEGGAGDDLLTGNTGHDNIYGGTGNDVIYGGAGQDFLNGDEGNDQIFGDAGNDGLNGGDGNDWLEGGEGTDHLRGELGDDYLYGGAEVDTFYDGGQAGDVIVDAPRIVNFGARNESGYWYFEGTVLDEYDPVGYVVYFGGLLSGYSATVSIDGVFRFFLKIDFGIGGNVSSQTTDVEGLASNIAYVHVSG